MVNRAILNRTTRRVTVSQNVARGLCAFLFFCDVKAQLTPNHGELRQIQLPVTSDLNDIEMFLRLWHESCSFRTRTAII